MYLLVFIFYIIFIYIAIFSFFISFFFSFLLASRGTFKLSPFIVNLDRRVEMLKEKWLPNRTGGFLIFA